MKNKASLYRISLAAILVCLIFASPSEAEKLEFSLTDSYGRQVSSQDYEGVPIFLEFGACW
jgi:cytochrome oxidase Cu insertion factor (SCO1/SenC/PrrC family)